MNTSFVRIKRTVIFKLHWRVGLAAAFLVVWVALTGLLLHHARAIGLHQLHSEWPPLLYAYNMQLPEGYVQNIEHTPSHITITTQDNAWQAPLGTDIDAAIAHAYRGDGVNIEKLILDLHTGHLFGLPGMVLFDLTALAMIFLTVTGLYNLWQRKRC